MAGSKQVGSLQTLLTRDWLLEMAGDRYFARGEDYFRRGYVHDLAEVVIMPMFPFQLASVLPVFWQRMNGQGQLFFSM